MLLYLFHLEALLNTYLNNKQNPSNTRSCTQSVQRHPRFLNNNTSYFLSTPVLISDRLDCTLLNVLLYLFSITLNVTRYFLSTAENCNFHNSSVLHCSRAQEHKDRLLWSKRFLLISQLALKIHISLNGSFLLTH